MRWTDVDWLLPVVLALACAWLATSAWRTRRQLAALERITGTPDDQQRRVAERFQQVFELAPAARLIVDASGRVFQPNAQACALFGRDRPQLTGSPLNTLVQVDDAASSVPPNLPAGEWLGQLSKHESLCVARPDGARIPVRVCVQPLAGDNMYLASIEDLTAERASQREVALQREELTHLSRVGTLSAMSASIAHELNQPLAAILSNAQAAQRFLARDPPDLDEVRASLDDIVADDKRAGDVIRQLRAMLKKQSPSREPLHINELVREALHLARGDMLTRNTTTSTHLAAGLPLVLGDRVQLQQVLINLLLNAADAMTTSEGPHALDVRSSVTAEGRVEVAICDNGTGIPPADLERIFEPFYSSKLEGMGLGLSICHSIIQSHGGGMVARNNPEHGATVRFWLPAIVATGREAPPSTGRH